MSVKVICENDEIAEEVQKIARISHIDDLNDNCLEKIFEHIASQKRLSLELVCTRWRDLGQEGWPTPKNLSIGNFSKLPEVLIRCGRFLEGLEVYGLRFTDNLALSTIRDECTNLIKLKLKFENDDRYTRRFRDPVHIFSNMKKLESLTVRISSSVHQLSNQFFRSLRADIPEFRVIVDPIKTRQPFHAGFCSSLRTQLEAFDAIHSFSVRGVPLSPIIPKIITEQSLVKLDISNCKSTIADELSEISNLINLEQLIMSQLKSVNDSVLAAIVAKCKNLKRLNIKGCKNITDDGIGMLANSLNLEDLNIGNIPRIRGTELSQLHNLKTLNCRNSINLKISKDMLEKLTRLERLDVRGAAIIPGNVIWAIEAGHCRSVRTPLCFVASYKSVNAKHRFSGLISPSVFLDSVYR